EPAQRPFGTSPGIHGRHGRGTRVHARAAGSRRLRARQRRISTAEPGAGADRGRLLAADGIDRGDRHPDRAVGRRAGRRPGAGGRAVVDGRLSLGALVAFNGYLAYLTWPTLALGWTLSTVRRGLTSMTRILEIVEESTASGRSGVSEPARTSLRPPSVEAGL